MKVVDAIAQILKAEGVEYLFAYPINHIIEAAAKVGIRPIIVRQERVGLHMADALSRMSSGRRVGVRVGSARGEAWATVWDTGIGISQDQQARVFDRFYQAECSLTRQYGGMGLGLSIVKEMVDLHHGSVSLESQPGKGSAFTIRIPVYQTAREC